MKLLLLSLRPLLTSRTWLESVVPRLRSLGLINRMLRCDFSRAPYYGALNAEFEVVAQVEDAPRTMESLCKLFQDVLLEYDCDVCGMQAEGPHCESDPILQGIRNPVYTWQLNATIRLWGDPADTGYSFGRPDESRDVFSPPFCAANASGSIARCLED
jgi:hypothetical protein